MKTSPTPAGMAAKELRSMLELRGFDAEVITRAGKIIVLSPAKDYALDLYLNGLTIDLNGVRFSSIEQQTAFVFEGKTSERD